MCLSLICRCRVSVAWGEVSCASYYLVSWRDCERATQSDGDFGRASGLCRRVGEHLSCGPCVRYLVVHHLSPSRRPWAPVAVCCSDGRARDPCPCPRRDDPGACRGGLSAAIATLIGSVGLVRDGSPLDLERGHPSCRARSCHRDAQTHPTFVCYRGDFGVDEVGQPWLLLVVEVIFTYGFISEGYGM